MKFIASWFIFVIGIGLASLSQAQTVQRVDSRQALIDALKQVAPGTVVEIAPGQYDGGLYFVNLRGTGDAPIIIRAADPASPPVFQGGNEGLKISGAGYLELHHIIIEGARHNGLNIDDADNPDAPTRMITLHSIVVRNLHRDNHAVGIKLSGVYDFEIIDSRVENWGISAAGIDMVGCHRGRIASTTIRSDPDKPSAVGIQTKGGSTGIVIEHSRFDHAGDRGVNIGGRTGETFFRPRERMGYEARDITVQGCVFIGSQSPIVFASASEGLVRFNTFYHPKKWFVRILQDASWEGIKPCANGVIRDNLIVFRSDELVMDAVVNIGAGTQPESFTFARNFWYCENEPSRSRIQLPKPLMRMGDIHGPNPQFANPTNPAEADFKLLDESPAKAFGHTALH